MHRLNFCSLAVSPGFAKALARLAQNTKSLWTRTVATTTFWTTTRVRTGAPVAGVHQVLLDEDRRYHKLLY